MKIVLIEIVDNLKKISLDYLDAIKKITESKDRIEKTGRSLEEDQFRLYRCNKVILIEIVDQLISFY